MSKAKKRLLIFGLSVLSIIIGAFYLVPKYAVIDNPDVVVSNFAAYDLARAVVKDEKQVYLLLAPGAELHNYEPSPQDLIRMDEAKLFIYNGGESEDWAEHVLESGAFETTDTLRLMDLIDLKEEEIVEGMVAEDEETDEGEPEYDEHIWTSPLNMIALLDGVADKIRDAGIDVDEEKLADYRKQLQNVDNELHAIVDGAKRKEIIVGDRFPFRYFADELGLKYYAAYPGCAEETEVNARTVAFLEERIREDEIPVAFKTELSAGWIADVIAKETNTEMLTLYAAHNVSRDDFEKGVTYVDLMRRNVEMLRKALN